MTLTGRRDDTSWSGVWVSIPFFFLSSGDVLLRYDTKLTHKPFGLNGKSCKRVDVRAAGAKVPVASRGCERCGCSLIALGALLGPLAPTRVPRNSTQKGRESHRGPKKCPPKGSWRAHGRSGGVLGVLRGAYCVGLGARWLPKWYPNRPHQGAMMAQMSIQKPIKRRTETKT